eukprot:9994619-Ditylum_brightwellii.AAC.2
MAKILAETGHRLTHVRELVKTLPHLVDYCNVAASGAGGAWFTTFKHSDPIVWRHIWSEDIRQAVILNSNPKGRLTNSDLKLAAKVIHFSIALVTHPMRHLTMLALSDNLATVHWSHCMAAKANTKTAGALLRGLALVLRECQAALILTLPVEVNNNTMANFASHLTHLVQEDLVVYSLATLFPLHAGSWISVAPPAELLWCMTLTLRERRC